MTHLEPLNDGVLGRMRANIDANDAFRERLERKAREADERLPRTPEGDFNYTNVLAVVAWILETEGLLTAERRTDWVLERLRADA